MLSVASGAEPGEQKRRGGNREETKGVEEISLEHDEEVCGMSSA